MIVRSADTAKFDTVPGEYTRIAVGGAPDGWLAYEDAVAPPRTSRRTARPVPTSP